MDNEQKIEVTQHQLLDALMDLFVKGDLKGLTNEMPIMVLLVPIIAKALWENLNKEEEETE